MDYDMPDLLLVKPFQETLHAGMCGPASLKMVLAYYGVGKTEAELAKLCDTDPDLGTTDMGRIYRSGFFEGYENIPKAPSNR